MYECALIGGGLLHIPLLSLLHEVIIAGVLNFKIAALAILHLRQSEYCIIIVVINS